MFLTFPISIVLAASPRNRFLGPNPTRELNVRREKFLEIGETYGVALFEASLRTISTPRFRATAMTYKLLVLCIPVSIEYRVGSA